MNKTVLKGVLVAAVAVLFLRYSSPAYSTGGELTTRAIKVLDAIFSVSTPPSSLSGVVSCNWNNAQVVALGAVLSGDVACLTLAPKTVVKNSYIVITGQASGTTTLTVSLGDAVGGTPFINYVVASNAKAAANTVYGDAVAERGTAQDIEYYNFPSYTASTAVTLHFISTVENLNASLGSSGKAILETVVLP